MSAAVETTITVSIPELEAIIQRAVQEAVRKEMKHVLFEFWTQEGEDDLDEEERVLADALMIVEQRKQDRAGWKTLEEFEAELASVK
jgi:hypothetical protein